MFALVKKNYYGNAARLPWILQLVAYNLVSRTHSSAKNSFEMKTNSFNIFN